MSGKVTVSPQYIEQRVREVNDELWALTQYYFEDFNIKRSDGLFDIGGSVKTITVRGQDDFSAEYTVLAGMTESGRFLSDEDCRAVFTLPVVSSSEDGRRSARWLRESTGGGRPHELDRLVLPDEYIRRAVDEAVGAVREEIARLRVQTADRKAGLERGVEALRGEVSALTGGLDRASSIAEKVQAEKRKAAAQKELKQREQQLFLDGMRLDLELEEQIKSLTDAARFNVSVRRQFVIKVYPK